jgi:hypothetical protein
MAGIAREDRLSNASDAEPILKLRLGRIGRWFICGVILAAAPVAGSLMFLPRNSSAVSVLGHGDIAVLASALVAASLGELVGPDEPVKWIRNLLLLLSICLLFVTVILLVGIAGMAPELTVRASTFYSWITLALAIVLGSLSWGSTTHRCRCESGNGHIVLAGLEDGGE